MLKISQRTIAEQLADEYGEEFGKGVPLPVGTKLAEFDENEAPGDWPFRELVGSLMWLSTQTRPDISNAARAEASKVLRCTKVSAPEGSNRRFRVCETDYCSSFGITFQRGATGGLTLQIFGDADNASKAADKRSDSGGLVMRGGACASWSSGAQKYVTLSTTEAEYVALADVIKEVLFFRQVWPFMLPEVGMPCIPVFEDNQGAVQLAQNPITNSNAKHIDVRHHFLRELVGTKYMPWYRLSAYRPCSSMRIS